MDELYQLAFAFKKAKLWKKLWDNQLFAVQLSDGETGYCSVMGRNGEHFALAMYPGDSGLMSYCMISKGPDGLDGIHDAEFYLSQECVMCSFENKEQLRMSELSEVRGYCAKNGITLRGAHAWPQLQRCRPFHLPWMIREESDKQCLKEALLAGLEVAAQLERSTASRLGLEEGYPFDREIPLLVRNKKGYEWQRTMLPSFNAPSYPEANGLYDVSLKRAKDQKKRVGTWSCDVFLLPEAVTDEATDGERVEEPYNAPHYPWTQLVCDEDHDLILDTLICKGAEDYSEEFPNRFLDLISKLGKPRKLLVETERTASLYKELTKMLGIQLEVVDGCSGLDEAQYSLFEQFAPDHGDIEESEMVAELMEMLHSCSDFSVLPDEALIMLDSLAQMMADDIPNVQIQRLKKELGKRFR